MLKFYFLVSILFSLNTYADMTCQESVYCKDKDRTIVSCFGAGVWADCEQVSEGFGGVLCQQIYNGTISNIKKMCPPSESYYKSGGSIDTFVEEVLDI